MIVSLGRERMERSREINCPSLGFSTILDMSDTSSVRQTHSCIMDKGREPCKINCPSFGFLRGSKLADGLKVASTS